jgi:hypothetical protein
MEVPRGMPQSRMVPSRAEADVPIEKSFELRYLTAQQSNVAPVMQRAGR